MATLSSDGKYVTVERGDTLWGIASKHLGSGSKYQQLANWNNISNPNYIVVGQKIYLSKDGSSTTTTTTSSSNTVTIKTLGPLASDDKTIYARWTWGKMSQTKEFKLVWRYRKDGVDFDSNPTSISVDQDWQDGSLQTTYNIPDGAISVSLKIKPVSLIYKVKQGDKEVDKTHFDVGFCGWNTYTVDNPVPTPSAPSTDSIDIDKNNKLTITLDKIDTSVYTHFKFEIIQNDTTLVKTSEKLAVNKYGYVTYSYNVAAGNNYKVRCMGYKNNFTSNWSPFSDSVQSRPSAPTGEIICKGSEKGTDDKYTVYLEWKSVNSADSYDVQYTTDKNYFDTANGQTTIVPVEDGLTSTTIVQLEPGEYFFRVRAKNEKGESDWTDIVSVKMGEPPGVPTTWESTTRAIVGEPLNLYWVHNSLDGSTQTWALLYLSTDGGATSIYYEIKNDGYYGIDSNGTKYLIKSFTDDDQKDETSVCSIDTNLFREGAELTWWVRTAGITNTAGKESVYRSVDIYEKPSLDLLVTDEFTVSDKGEITLITPEGGTMGTLGSFPFYIKAVSNNTSQTPIGYSLSITANGSYETVDLVGNDKTVSTGDEVYSKYFDTSEILVVEMSANNIDLENGVEYQVTCTVSMDSGLTATAYSTFTVSWSDTQYHPNAEIAIDRKTYTASIRPYCEDRQFVYKQVEKISSKYSVLSDEIDVSTLDDAYTTTLEKVYLGVNARGVETYYCIVYVDNNGNSYDTPLYYKVTLSDGVYTKTSTRVTTSSINRVITETGEQVLLGTINGNNVYYCETEITTTVEDVTLAVYRREFDGGFTEIASNLSNVNNTYVTDPHPALDYARYRIVARTNSTGAISYYDIPGHPVACSSIIIQWDEKWSSFNQWSEDNLAEPPWAGSLLELPYNVDESDSTNSDVTLVKYIGRKRPVSYYGTQLGETASWNSTIAKDDLETIYALRRLSIWSGDVYVRSPSGVGYWAHVKPSFNLKHRDVTVPVTLNITRVEGGM